MPGRRRSNVRLPGYLTGRSPHNEGMSYPADPPRVEEIIAVCAGRAMTATACGSER